MKRFAAVLLVLVCVAAGVVRWLDVINYTDPATGFVTYGPAWARYAVAAGVLALAALGSLLAPRRPAALCGQSAPQGLVCWLCAVGFAALAGARLAGWASLAGMALAQTVLCLVSAVWFFLLGTSRFTPDFETPTRSALWGVAGTLSLYLLTVCRFGLEPTGMARVGENFEALAALAALLFCTAQAKVAYLPGGRSGGWVFFTGLAAFLFCGCLALPGALAGWFTGQLALADLLEAAAVALVGLVGAVYALGAAGPAAPEPAAPARQEENVKSL